MQDFSALEHAIRYTFKDQHLVQWAMTHSTYYNEHRSSLKGDNERLEFLGDSVLELVSSEYLFKKNPKMREGDLTRLRASKVCEPALASCARGFCLEQFILLGKGEEKTGGREKDSIISDALEALIGAIFLDGGFDNAKIFILKFIMEVQEENECFCDSKTQLQEYVQKHFLTEPEYRQLNVTGSTHNPLFEQAVYINGVMYAKGYGRSKKDAQQVAAKETLEQLRKNEGHSCI